MCLFLISLSLSLSDNTLLYISIKYCASPAFCSFYLSFIDAHCSTPILIRLSFCPYVHLSIYSYIYSSIQLSIYLSIHLSIHASIQLFIYPSIHRFIYQSKPQLIYRCVSLIFISLNLSFFAYYYSHLSHIFKHFILQSIKHFNQLLSTYMYT